MQTNGIHMYANNLQSDRLRLFVPGYRQLQSYVLAPLRFDFFFFALHVLS